MKQTLIQPFIQKVIERLENPETVRNFSLVSENSHPDAHVPLYHSWNDLSLATGLPGILLLFTRLDQLGFTNGEISHRYVLEIKKVLEQSGISNFSLFGGLTGVAFAINEASFEETRYQKMLDKLHQHLLIHLQDAYISPLAKSPTESGAYDVIQGASGVGRYLLEHVEKPDFYQALIRLIEALIAFTKPKSIQGKEVPGWFLSPEDILNARKYSQTRGNFNLGLAHGIPGVMAFLSIALMKGVEVAGQKDAISLTAQWIQHRGSTAASQTVWPYHITWEEEVEGKKGQEVSKDAWCYGTPGVARSLFLAGGALKNEQLKSLAIESLRGVFTRDQSDWDLPGPMLCHGLAGLYLIARAMGEEVCSLKEQILTFYNPDHPFGFSDIEWSKKGQPIVVHKPGFLEGASGLLLAILSEHKPDSKWNLPLML